MIRYAAALIYQLRRLTNYINKLREHAYLLGKG